MIYNKNRYAQPSQWVWCSYHKIIEAMIPLKGCVNELEIIFAFFCEVLSTEIWYTKTKETILGLFYEAAWRIGRACKVKTQESLPHSYSPIMPPNVQGFCYLPGSEGVVNHNRHKLRARACVLACLRPCIHACMRWMWTKSQQRPSKALPRRCQGKAKENEMTKSVGWH